MTLGVAARTLYSCPPRSRTGDPDPDSRPHRANNNYKRMGLRTAMLRCLVGLASHALVPFASFSILALSAQPQSLGGSEFRTSRHAFACCFVRPTRHIRRHISIAETYLRICRASYNLFLRFGADSASATSTFRRRLAVNRKLKTITLPPRTHPKEATIFDPCFSKPLSSSGRDAVLQRRYLTFARPPIITSERLPSPHYGVPVTASKTRIGSTPVLFLRVKVYSPPFSPILKYYNGSGDRRVTPSLAHGIPGDWALLHSVCRQRIP
jgi:hypothetical protein